MQGSHSRAVVMGGGGSEASGRVDVELKRFSTELFHNIITRIR